MDNGEWTFSIESKERQNKTLMKYRHIIGVRQNGKQIISSNNRVKVAIRIHGYKYNI